MPVRVLLVEDSRADATLIQTITARSSVPVQIAVADDGLAALVRLATFKPDLIISDLVLPRTPGTGLLGRPETNGIPIVIFSSSVNPADAEEARRLGACDFVPKPIDLEEFTETLWGIIWKWALRDQQAKT